MKSKKSRQSRIAKLYEIAESQQGFFTPKQAQNAGFIATNHTYYVKQGAWIKEDRGIYRLRQFPTSEAMDLIMYSLWSRDRSDRVMGVYSHETALSIHELSDVMPSKLHMTVPLNFRKSAKTPKILCLHRNDLESGDVEIRQGYRVTKPFRTIIDLIDEKNISMEFVEQALVEGVNRGLITIKELRSDKIQAPLRHTVEARIKASKKVRTA